jgi:hypothetical protein
VRVLVYSLFTYGLLTLSSSLYHRYAAPHPPPLTFPPNQRPQQLVEEPLEQSGTTAIGLMDAALNAEREGNLTASLELMTEAIRVAEGEGGSGASFAADMYSSRAFVNLELKNLKAAISDASRAIKTRTSSSSGAPVASDYLTRAMAFEELRMDDNAIRDYKEAQRLEPANRVARESLEYLVGGRCKNKKKAEKEEDDEEEEEEDEEDEEKK